MIIQKNIPFVKRAQFMRDSLSPYPEGPEFAQYVSEQAIDTGHGLQSWYSLLQRYYTDVEWIEGKDDDAKFDELVATMAFLYAFFVVGTLIHESGGYSVSVDKTLLRKQYKRGRYARREQHLERHGFSLAYLSDGSECRSLRQASHLVLTYDGHPAFIPALKHLAGSIAVAEEGTGAQKPIYNKLGMFMKGDIASALRGNAIPRDALDPLGSDILNAIDEYRQPWVDMVTALRDRCGLSCSGFWTYGGVPAWGVSFAAKRKRPLAIFTLGSNHVFIEFTLPVDAAEAIIRERHGYSEPIRNKIEAFHCVKCPKECQGSNIVRIDGVSLCTGRAEARRIYTVLSSQHDFDSILSMLDKTC